MTHCGHLVALLGWGLGWCTRAWSGARGARGGSRRQKQPSSAACGQTRIAISLDVVDRDGKSAPFVSNLRASVLNTQPPSISIYHRFEMWTHRAMRPKRVQIDEETPGIDETIRVNGNGCRTMGDEVRARPSQLSRTGRGRMGSEHTTVSSTAAVAALASSQTQLSRVRKKKKETTKRAPEAIWRGPATPTPSWVPNPVLVYVQCSFSVAQWWGSPRTPTGTLKPPFTVWDPQTAWNRHGMSKCMYSFVSFRFVSFLDLTWCPLARLAKVH